MDGFYSIYFGQPWYVGTVRVMRCGLIHNFDKGLAVAATCCCSIHNFDKGLAVAASTLIKGLLLQPHGVRDALACSILKEFRI